jgi:mannose-1-phosphate guanylyltransferase/phosphomannomutase
MQALILAGGKATRLRPLCNNIPKALLPLGDKPFILYQLNQLKYNMISDIIVCVGYLADLIIDELQDGSQWGISIEYSREEQLLGTAGALKLAAPLLDRTFMVLNGDSLSQLSFVELINYHERNLEIWQNYLGTITLMEKSNDERYGSVVMDDEDMIISFKEKKGIPNQKSYHNRGIYIFQKQILDFIPKGCVFSLEEDLLPQIINSHYKLGGFKDKGFFIDIGTQKSYRDAEELYKTHRFPKIFYL